MLAENETNFPCIQLKHADMKTMPLAGEKMVALHLRNKTVSKDSSSNCNDKISKEEENKSKKLTGIEICEDVQNLMFQELDEKEEEDNDSFLEDSEFLEEGEDDSMNKTVSKDSSSNCNDKISEEEENKSKKLTGIEVCEDVQNLMFQDLDEKEEEDNDSLEEDSEFLEKEEDDSMWRMKNISFDKKTHRRNLCYFKSCRRNKASYPTLHFFSFPVNRPSICDAWVRNCANEAVAAAPKKTLNKMVVCEKHFEDRCFTSNLKTRLLPSAIPTVLNIDGAPRTVTEQIQVSLVPVVNQEPIKVIETQEADISQLSDTDRPVDHEVHSPKALLPTDGSSHALPTPQSVSSTPNYKIVRSVMGQQNNDMLYCKKRFLDKLNNPKKLKLNFQQRMQILKNKKISSTKKVEVLSTKKKLPGNVTGVLYMQLKDADMKTTPLTQKEKLLDYMRKKAIAKNMSCFGNKMNSNLKKDVHQPNTSTSSKVFEDLKNILFQDLYEEEITEESDDFLPKCDSRDEQPVHLTSHRSYKLSSVEDTFPQNMKDSLFTANEIGSSVNSTNTEIACTSEKAEINDTSFFNMESDRKTYRSKRAFVKPNEIHLDFMSLAGTSNNDQSKHFNKDVENNNVKQDTSNSKEKKFEFSQDLHCSSENIDVFGNSSLNKAKAMRASRVNQVVQLNRIHLVPQSLAATTNNDKSNDCMEFKNKQETSKSIINQKYICALCKCRTSDLNIMKSYACIHSGDHQYIFNISNYNRETYTCSLCQYSTTSICNENLNSCSLSENNQHIFTRKLHTVYGCLSCNYATEKIYAMTIHCLDHLGKITFTCSKCDYVSTKRGEMLSHIQGHYREKCFSCTQCSYITSNRNYLVVHMKKHSEEKLFACSHCKYKTTQKTELTDHLRKHTGDNLHACSQCEFRAATRSNLISHMAKHSEEKPFHCTFCSYTSKKKASLALHMKIHTMNEIYSCFFCEYKSTTIRNLVSHIKTHDAEKPYRCSECSYRSAKNAYLRMHTRFVHRKERPFKCSQCHFATAHRTHLTSHMRKHTGEKPFSCNQCEYKASYRPNLIRHMKVHTGEKPFTCSLCEYVCIQKVQLISHLKKHFKKNN